MVKITKMYYFFVGKKVEKYLRTKGLQGLKTYKDIRPTKYLKIILYLKSMFTNIFDISQIFGNKKR